MRPHCLSLLLVASTPAFAITPNLIDQTHGSGAGSFELGTYSNNSGNAYDYMRLTTGQTVITGWTVAGAAGVDWMTKPSASNAMDGIRSVDICGQSNGSNGEISTVIPTVVGRSYLISFGAYGGNNNANGTLTAGSLVQNFVGQGSADPSTASFASFQYWFTATSDTTTITFASVDGTGFGPVIDNVVVLSDRDGDKIPDVWETNTGTIVSSSDTGSNPDLADSDGDGLDDGVEVFTHGSNPNSSDSDGDGFSDGFEVNTGYNPASADSTPEAQSSIRAAVEFRFNAASGVSYRIEGSADLVNWEIVEGSIPGQGTVVTRFYSTENQPKRFFRAKRN